MDNHKQIVISVAFSRDPLHELIDIQWNPADRRKNVTYQEKRGEKGKIDFMYIILCPCGCI